MSRVGELFPGMFDERIPGLQARVATITPELALRILERNTEDNRKLDNRRILGYSASMLAGRWKVITQGITLGKEAILIDGQNRLKAIIKANIPVDMLIGYDPSRESALGWEGDQGKKRSKGYALGEPDDRIVNAASFIAQIGLGDHRVFDTNIRSVMQALRPELDRLHSEAGTMTRGISQASIRSAVVCRMAIHPERSHDILRWYRDLINHDPTDVPGVVKSLYQRIMKGTSSRGKDEDFARAFKAFYPDIATTRSVVRDRSESISLAREEVRELLAKRGVRLTGE